VDAPAIAEIAGRHFRAGWFGIRRRVRLWRALKSTLSRMCIRTLRTR